MVFSLGSGGSPCGRRSPARSNQPPQLPLSAKNFGGRREAVLSLSACDAANTHETRPSALTLIRLEWVAAQKFWQPLRRVENPRPKRKVTGSIPALATKQYVGAESGR